MFKELKANINKGHSEWRPQKLSKRNFVKKSGYINRIQ